MLGVNDMIADGSYMFGQDIQTATGKIRGSTEAATRYLYSHRIHFGCNG